MNAKPNLINANQGLTLINKPPRRMPVHKLKQASYKNPMLLPPNHSVLCQLSTASPIMKILYAHSCHWKHVQPVTCQRPPQESHPLCGLPTHWTEVTDPFPKHLLHHSLPEYPGSVYFSQHRPAGHPPGLSPSWPANYGKGSTCYNQAKFITGIFGYSPRSIAASLNPLKK